MDVRVEICAEGIVSALAAEEGGADRVELCENRAVGGVTPGLGVVAMASVNLAIPVHALIRPRSGDFAYNTAEYEVMRSDIGYCRGADASSVVLGLLDRSGRIDRKATAGLVKEARPMSVTFHKAFDATRDPFEALDDLIELGVDRVLTSGHAPTAMEGLATLAELTRRGAGRIAVMAGGSIALDQVRTILGAGIREIHLGSAALVGGVTDAGLVRRIVEEASMTQVYHIISRAEWDLARQHGAYRPPSLATEGFIHASTSRQLAGTAHRFYRGRDDLILLRIDLDRVTAPVRWENSPHSPDPFPHLHGELNLDAVTATATLAPDPDGDFSDAFEELVWTLAR